MATPAETDEAERVRAAAAQVEREELAADIDQAQQTLSLNLNHPQLDEKENTLELLLKPKFLYEREASAENIEKNKGKTHRHPLSKRPFFKVDADGNWGLSIWDETNPEEHLRANVRRRLLENVALSRLFWRELARTPNVASRVAGYIPPRERLQLRLINRAMADAFKGEPNYAREFHWKGTFDEHTADFVRRVVGPGDTLIIKGKIESSAPLVEALSENPFKVLYTPPMSVASATKLAGGLWFKIDLQRVGDLDLDKIPSNTTDLTLSGPLAQQQVDIIVEKNLKLERLTFKGSVSSVSILCPLLAGLKRLCMKFEPPLSNDDFKSIVNATHDSLEHLTILVPAGGEKILPCPLPPNLKILQLRMNFADDWSAHPFPTGLESLLLSCTNQAMVGPGFKVPTPLPTNLKYLNLSGLSPGTLITEKYIPAKLETLELYGEGFRVDIFRASCNRLEKLIVYGSPAHMCRARLCHMPKLRHSEYSHVDLNVNQEGLLIYPSGSKTKKSTNLRLNFRYVPFE